MSDAAFERSTSDLLYVGPEALQCTLPRQDPIDHEGNDGEHTQANPEDLQELAHVRARSCSHRAGPPSTMANAPDEQHQGRAEILHQRLHHAAAAQVVADGEDDGSIERRQPMRAQYGGR